jgi:hypothetical protein
MHRELIAPLSLALTEIDVADVRQMSSFIWGVLDAAINRVESQGCDSRSEGDSVIAFIQAGIAAK